MPRRDTVEGGGLSIQFTKRRKLSEGKRDRSLNVTEPPQLTKFREPPSVGVSVHLGGYIREDVSQLFCVGDCESPQESPFLRFGHIYQI